MEVLTGREYKEAFWWQMIKMCHKFKYNQKMVLQLQKDKPKSTIT